MRNVKCTECGMVVEIGEYHPYAACLMFKGCKDSSVVKKNLEAIIHTWRNIGRREHEHEYSKITGPR